MFRNLHTYIITFIIGVVLCLTACTIRPDDVLSAGKMEDVLYDLHRADGIMYVQGYEYGHYDRKGKYYQTVLTKHGITQAQFDSSLVWYTDHPKRFDKIYPKVIERLTAEKDLLAAINEPSSTGTSATADTIMQLPVRSLDDWKRIMQSGLPLAWGVDTFAIDTAFIYPYITTLQDSLQQAMQADTITSKTTTTEATKPVIKVDTKPTPTVNIWVNETKNTKPNREQKPATRKQFPERKGMIKKHE